MKTKKIKSIFFLTFFLTFLFISVSSFSPTVLADSDTTEISAGDIIKNFRFASIGDEPIVSRGAFDNKLRFEKQDEWTINRDTIVPVDCHSVSIEDGGLETYLRYKIEARTRINMFTNFRTNQVSFTFYGDVEEEFLAGSYEHWGCFGGFDPLIEWQQFITWEHWDFGGSIIEYNEQENVFSGAVAMEFDISPNPLPDVFGEGDSAKNDWAYIVVDSAGVVHNEMGDMSKDELPETVTLSPSVYDSEERNEYIQTDEKTVSKTFDARFDPMTYLSDPFLKEQFAEGIIPHSAGASLNPKNLDGTLPWDVETMNESMTGCRLEYDLNSLSPKVRKMAGRLVYYETALATRDVLSTVYVVIPVITVEEWYYSDSIMTKDRDAAMQVINRYLQTEIRVIFDIWTKANIGPLTPYYEQMKLAKPEQFYEELIWSSIAGGWGGSYQRTTAPTIADVDSWLIVIVIVVVIVVVYVLITVVLPMVRGQKVAGAIISGGSRRK